MDINLEVRASGSLRVGTIALSPLRQLAERQEVDTCEAFVLIRCPPPVSLLYHRPFFEPWLREWLIFCPWKGRSAGESSFEGDLSGQSRFSADERRTMVGTGHSLVLSPRHGAFRDRDAGRCGVGFPREILRMSDPVPWKGMRLFLFRVRIIIFAYAWYGLSKRQRISCRLLKRQYKIAIFARAKRI